MKNAKYQDFLEIYIDPELLRFDDKSNRQNRYITANEIAFVASRITTSALRNGYSTHKVSYNTFMTKWKDDYKKFTSCSPSKHKLGHIVEVLGYYKIISQKKRVSSTPIYAIGINNPYHPDYKPAKSKYPDTGYRTTNSHAKSLKTPNQLQSESNELDKEFENILTDTTERTKNENS